MLYRVSIFPGGSDSIESACSAGDLDSIPGLGRSAGEGKGYRLQYSGLKDSTDCMVHGVATSQTQQSDFHFMWKTEASCSFFNPPGPFCTFARTAIMRRASWILFLGPPPQPECHSSRWEFSPCQTEMRSQRAPRRSFLVAQVVKNPPAMQETLVWSLGGDGPLEKGMAAPPVFLPGESHVQRCWRVTVHGVAESQAWLSYWHSHTPGDLNAPCFIWWRE